MGEAGVEPAKAVPDGLQPPSFDLLDTPPGGEESKAAFRRQSHAQPDRFSPMTDLDGRVIAIAGAGGGLGPVVAQRLADAGASLALADRSQEIADTVAQGLRVPGDR